MKIVVHQAVVIGETVPQQEFVGDVRELPSGGHIARRWPAGNLSDQVDGLPQHILFLLWGHGNRILMRIPMCPNFMSILYHQTRLLRKCLERVPWDKPGRSDVMRAEKLE